MKETELPLISVNILSWNRKPDLSFILNKIREADYPKDKLEIIVVDNASTDGTPEMVAKNFPEVKLIRRGENNGIGGWNDGFAVARGEYVMVLDDDAYPEPDAFFKIVDFFQQHPKTAVLNLANFSWSDPAQPSREPLDELTTLGFTGGTAVIRKQVLDKVGFYDERLFIGIHESDLGVRILNQGFKISDTHQIKAFHKVGISRYYKPSFYYHIRNRLWLAWKYFPLHAILISNIIWLVYWFLFSLRMNAIKEFCLGIQNAFAEMGYLRRSWPRHRLVNRAVTKRLLRRFNYELIIKGIKVILQGPSGKKTGKENCVGTRIIPLRKNQE